MGVESLSGATPEAQIYQNSDYYEAKMLLSKRKWNEAAIVLRTVLKRSPDFTPAAVGLADALAYSGRREEAVSILDQMIPKENAKSRAALIARVRVLSKVFITKETFQSYQDGLNFLFAKKTHLARDKFEKALLIEPDNVEILTRLGQCMVLDGDFDSASERLRLAHKLDPYEPEVSAWLGRALNQRGEASQAIAELQAAQKDNPSSEMGAIWLAEALENAGQKAQGIQTLEENIRAYPSHVAALYELQKMRTAQASTPDRKTLQAVGRDLRLGLSRVSVYPDAFKPASEDLALDVRPTAAELKDGIEKLLSKLEQESSNRSAARTFND
jgi:predicted Zn-dependent protease